MNNNRRSNTVPFRRNGRFCKFKPDTQDSLLKAAKRDVYNARKERLKNEFFDKFVALFFLKGDEKNWIPTSRCRGTIVALAKIFFKRSYLLQRNSRSEKLHLIYAGGDPRDVKPITNWRLTRDASLNAGPKCRVKIFSARRLPCIEKYSTDLQPVKEWLEELIGLGALNCFVDVAHRSTTAGSNRRFLVGGGILFIEKSSRLTPRFVDVAHGSTTAGSNW